MSNKYDQLKLNARFDKESQLWQKLYQPEGEKKSSYNNKKYRQRYVLEMLGPGAGKALDLGCGAGSFFEHLEGLGYEVVGLDSSEEMVKIASAQASSLKNSRAVLGNVLNLPFESNTFNGLIAVGLLEYLPNDEDFLRIVRSALRPGGRAVVTLRNSLCLERKLWHFYRKIGLDVNKADYFYREHNPKKFKKILESFGFKNIKVRYCHFYPLAWPLSRFFPALNNFLAHKMEKHFSGRAISFLGSTVIVSFEAPKE